MSADIKINWPGPEVTRREFFPYAVGFVGTLKLMFETAACSPNRVDSIFPSNQSLSLDYFTDEENLDRVINASQSFPLLDGQFSAPNIISPIPIITHDLSEMKRRLKIHGVLLGADQGDLLITLVLDKDVLIGSDFTQEQLLHYPAFIIPYDRDRQKLAVAMYARGEGDDIRKPIRALELTFNKKAADFIGNEFVCILNRGLFQHQKESASLLPIRFRLSGPTRMVG